MLREETGGHRAALFIADAERGPRRWLLPALLGLFMLAPLLRWGVPISQVGALPLHPELARDLPLPGLYTILLGGNEFSYKLLLGLSSLIATAGVAWASHRWWGTHSCWLTALWLSAPLPLTLLYHGGWPHRLIGVAFVAVGLGLLYPSRRWLAFPPLLAGCLLLWSTPSTLVAADLLRPLTIPQDSAVWLAQPAAPLPVVALVLAVVALTMAWERRARLPAARVALSVAGVGVGLALLVGVAPLGLTLATLGLILACGALPTLDRRFGAWPVLGAIVILSALAVYPALQPLWQDEPLAGGESALFGQAQLALLGTTLSDDGTELEVGWQLLAPLDRDLTVFVHLLDAEGETIAQADTPLLDEANRPSTQWPVGTTVRQTYSLDSGVTPVSTRLGLYEPISGTRLPRHEGGDSVTILLP